MEKTIRVKGKGKISVKPDTIKITIKAEGLCWNYDETIEHRHKTRGFYETL